MKTVQEFYDCQSVNQVLWVTANWPSAKCQLICKGPTLAITHTTWFSVVVCIKQKMVSCSRALHQKNPTITKLITVV